MSGLNGRQLLLVLAAFFATLVFGYFNLSVHKGGILDDALLDSSNKYRQTQKLIRDSKSAPDVGDAIGLVIPLSQGDDPRAFSKALEKIAALHQKVSAAFPKYGVLSLANSPNYRDDGETLLSSPFITKEFVEDIAKANGGIEKLVAWKQAVRNNPAVCGTLIGRDFDYAQVLLLLPRTYDEISVFRRFADLLEERKIEPYEWLWKTDIEPQGSFKNVLVSGWVIGRGLMDAALVNDTIRLSAVGILLTGILFLLFLGSWRQALIAVVLITMSLVWMRGTIGVLDALEITFYGEPLRERVYVLMAYTSLLVAGISFMLHRFEAYNATRVQFQRLPASEIWAKTRAVNSTLSFVAIISILNFATLYQIGVRGVMEVGALTVFGIVYLLLFAVWLLPAVHSLCGGESKAPGGVAPSLLEKIGAAISRLASNIQPLQALTILIVIVIVAGTIIAQGLITVKTRPLEFIQNTLVWRTGEFINADGRGGFDRLTLLIEPPKNSEHGIYDPEFLEQISSLEKDARRLLEVRAVSSAVDIVQVIARESYRVAGLPKDAAGAYAAFSLIESGTLASVAKQLWSEEGSERGIVLSVAVPLADSNRTGETLKALLRRSEELGLTALPFGKTAIYAEADRYIREGKPVNMATSQLIVIAAYIFWMYWWKLRRGGYAKRVYCSRVGIAASVPFVFSFGIMAITMAALSVPLDQATACVTALSINAAADFGIYILGGYREAIAKNKDVDRALCETLHWNSTAVLMDMILNIACFIPLIVSHFVPVARLGWVMVAMLLSCGIGVLLLMPPLLRWCARER